MGGLCLSVKLHREGSAPTACAAGMFMFVLFPSKEQEKCQILDHMISTLHMLMTKYPDCGWVAGGDKNQFPLAPLLAALPNSRQLVTQITYKKSGRIYDVLISNMRRGNIIKFHIFARPSSPSSSPGWRRLAPGFTRCGGTVS